MNEHSKTISIIIPSYNSGQYIEACLNSLEQQDYPKDKIEILVVDNGSSDQTCGIVKAKGVQLIETSDVSIAQSRNLGAKKSKGDILAFIDSDCEAPTDWLSNALTIMDEKKSAAVGCWYKPPEPSTFVERTWDALIKNRRETKGYVSWLPSSNFIVTREAFEQVNGFDPALTTAEDVQIGKKVIQQGERIYSDPILTVTHLDNPKTIGDFILKEKWRGEGVLQNFLNNSPKYQWNKAMAFTLVTALLLLSVAFGTIQWVFSGHFEMFLYTIIGLFIMNVFMSLKSIRSIQDIPVLIPLTLLFFTYGIGRVLSLFNLKIWKKSLLEKRQVKIS